MNDTQKRDFSTQIIAFLKSHKDELTAKGFDSTTYLADLETFDADHGVAEENSA